MKPLDIDLRSRRASSGFANRAMALWSAFAVAVWLLVLHQSADLDRRRTAQGAAARDTTVRATPLNSPAHADPARAAGSGHPAAWIEMLSALERAASSDIEIDLVDIDAAAATARIELRFRAWAGLSRYMDSLNARAAPIAWTLVRGRRDPGQAEPGVASLTARAEPRIAPPR